MLWRSSWRYLLRHPWLFGLSVLGVALGVAVVVSIDLANTSAQRAFQLSAESVTGKATHYVAGAAEGLDQRVYRTVRIDLGLRDSAPVVEGYAEAPAYDRTFQVLGVDPLAEPPFRPYLGRIGDEDSPDLSAFMTQPRTVLLSAPTAEELGLAIGDTLGLRIDGVDSSVRVVGVIEPENDYSEQAMANLLIVDVATAQELFDMTGRLSRIDLIVPDDTTRQATLGQIEAALPAGTEVIRSASRTRTIEQMTRAFELNLEALSLLALIVGMFLIYNTMTFSVVQRRAQVGRLRAIGVTRREVFTLILAEAALMGAVGTILGLLLGIALANVLVQLVTQTINDLYYVLSVRALVLDGWTLLKGVGLGVGATLLATIPPAREATSAPASTVLRRSQDELRVQAALPRLTAAGLVLGVGGTGLLLVGRSIALSYTAMLLLIVAAALLTPAAVALFSKALRPAMGRVFGILGRMSARGVVTTLSRTAVAIAALTVAVASTIGVGVMVDSFRETVEVWLDYTLQADVYVQPPSLVFRRGDATLQPEVVETLRTTEGVAAAYAVRSVETRSEHGRTDLVAIGENAAAGRTFRFKHGAAGGLWQAGEDVVIVSEPYSYRHEISVGDTLRLQTDAGVRPFAVAGVFYDYGSDLGVVMMGQRTFARHYDAVGASGLALFAAPGQDVDALIGRLRAQVDEGQEVIVRSNRALRETSMEVFDRTFTITVVLRLLAVLVAFIGVLSALMALQLERARELAVLRASGMTPGQLWRYVTMQTGLMGLIAGLLSLPLGLVLASVLVYVINRRSFGWTLQFEVTPEILLQALALALIAAVLAGLYPSWRMAQANPAMALREE